MYRCHCISYVVPKVLGYGLPGRYSGGGQAHQANDAFLTLTHLLQHLGLPNNNKKVEPPNHKIICLGIKIDAKQGTLSIPAEKLQKISKMCHNWLYKDKATRHQVQRLVGHLIYIHKCIPPARLFSTEYLVP